MATPASTGMPFLPASSTSRFASRARNAVSPQAVVIPITSISGLRRASASANASSMSSPMSVSRITLLGAFTGGAEPVCALADVHLVHLKDLPFFRATIPSKTQVALACARPILMAVNGDATDIVRKAGAGLTCPSEDETKLAEAMAALAETDRGELEAMGERGRRFYVEEMSLDVGGRYMDGLLKDVARSAGVNER